MTRPDAGHPPPATRVHSFRHVLQSRYAVILIALSLLLVLGVVILTDYGTSMDEGQNMFMGRLFLKVYETGSLLRSPGIEYFNGPFYFMVLTVTSRLFHALNPGWLLTDGLHLTNFIAFLIGVLFFYRICLRLLPRPVALFVVALFTTQPVLFGHAFINQKDTPLMVFFLASVELGWTAVESRISLERRQTPEPGGRPERPGMIEQWTRLSLAKKVLIVAGGLFGLLVLLDLWWVGSMHTGARTLFGEIYAGRGPAFLVALFGRIAEDASKTPISAYVAKLDSTFFWTRLLASFLTVAGLLALWRQALPVSYAKVVAPPSVGCPLAGASWG
jgi:hypothetical protein